MRSMGILDFGDGPFLDESFDEYRVQGDNGDLIVRLYDHPPHLVAFKIQGRVTTVKVYNEKTCIDLLVGQRN